MKIYIETLGCPKNFNDSQVAAGILEEHQYQITDSPEEADVIMVNTCGLSMMLKLNPSKEFSTWPRIKRMERNW